MITHVAIRYKGKIYSLPKPARHYHVIALIHKETGDQSIDAHGDDQGFLDEHGTYYRRTQALHHALLHDQLKPDAIIRANQLFSEDVW